MNDERNPETGKERQGQGNVPSPPEGKGRIRRTIVSFLGSKSTLLVLNTMAMLVFMLAVVISLVCSCSVKEDRSACACLLVVDLCEVHGGEVELRGWQEDRRGTIFDVITDAPSPEGPTGVVVPVPRGDVRVSSIRGRTRMRERMDILEIIPPNQMDSIFAHSSLVDAGGESARDTVRLLKNFATVYLTFRGDDPTLDAQYDLLVTGNVSGINVRTLEPVEGAFRCRTEDAPEGGYMFRVPRQLDDSLALERYLDGLPVDEIDIGRIIALAGFDWNSPSLGDVRIEADIPRGEFKVTILGWDGPSVMSVTI